MKYNCPAFELLVNKELEIKGDKNRNYILTDLEAWAIEQAFGYCIYPKRCGRLMKCRELYDKIAGRMRLPPVHSDQANAQGSGESDKTGSWIPTFTTGFKDEILRY